MVHSIWPHKPQGNSEALVYDPPQAQTAQKDAAFVWVNPRKGAHD